jgi:hypothetical protein
MSITGKAALVAAGLFFASGASAQQAPVAAPHSDIDEEAPPRPIEGIAPTYRTPVRDAQGYVTPNRDLSAEQATWHVRVALNVAALGCRDADERATVAAYNAVLATARDALAAAATGTERQYQVRFGAKWRSAHDDNMTRLYNFFAQTPAHDEFCATAKAVLAEAQLTAPADLGKLAKAALPRLEAPFLAFYARYDSYREELVAWQGRHAAPRVVVAVASAPVAIVAGSPVMVAVATPPAAPTVSAQPAMIAAAAPTPVVVAQVATAPVIVAAAAPTTPPVMVAQVSTLK